MLVRLTELIEKKFGKDSPNLISTLNNRAQLAEGLGRKDEAIKLAGRSLNISKKQGGPDHPVTAICEVSLANKYVAKGDYKKAEKLLKHAVPIIEKAMKPGSEAGQVALKTYAEVLEKLGKKAEAKKVRAKMAATKSSAK